MMNPKSKREMHKNQQWWVDWKPGQYPDDFWKWIVSINKGFEHRIDFDKFNIYRNQAYQWLKEFGPYPANGSVYEKKEYIRKNKEQFSINGLYFCNAVGKIKDSTGPDGYIEYEAYEAQEIMCFLDDLMMNTCAPKARQIGFTTTESLLSLRDIICFKSTFIKYIAQDIDKTEEIFQDKIKYPYQKLERHFRPTAENYSKLEINLAKKGDKKGEMTGMLSRVQVQAPKRDAINGGSPDKALVDEAGEQDVLSEMIAEGEPTLFGADYKTREIVQKRVMKIWGTGSKMDKGGGKFENLARPYFEAWAKKDFSHNIVPILFTYMARPGMTEEHYQKLKKAVYSLPTSNPERESRIVQFHQAYPKDLDEVFMLSSTTIIPRSEIISGKARIEEKRKYVKHGYFQPIYDTTKPKYPETYVVPYPILAAEFIETDEDDPRVTTCIIIPPAAWENRFYSGTDPINQETGNSEFSFSVWDEHLKTIAANVSFRSQNYKECYLQAHLCSMYYAHKAKKKFLEEVLENVIGDDYRNTRIELGTPPSVFVRNQMLPSDLQQASSSKDWGISNKSNNAANILAKMMTLYRTFHTRMYHHKFYSQLSSFVEKKLKGGGTSHRETRFQAANKDKHKDDVLFSDTFAFICAGCFSGRIPQQIGSIVVSSRKVKKRKVIQNQSTGFMQKRM